MPNYHTYCLTLIGTASIQSYVFGSNELAQNAGASHAVWQALEYWRQSEDLVYVGGGNAAVLHASRELANKAVADWSFNLARNYPGLRVVVVHREVENSLRETYKAALNDLQAAEGKPQFGSPLGALPVVRTCPSTGLGAGMKYTSPDGIVSWISAEAFGKWKFRTEAYDRLLNDCYSEVLNNCGVKPRFPRELDDLGITEGASQIAVVHADGDDIGTIFSRVVEEEREDEEFVQEIRSLSGKLHELAWDALRQTILDLVVASHQWLGEEVNPFDQHGNFLVPLRTIVWGGDDLTFVTNGRLGLAITAQYLRNFKEKSRQYFNQELTSSAGVVIVPLKFPFSRAYELAEDLSRGAKTQRRARRDGGCWMDFQIILEGGAESLKATRTAMYPARVIQAMRRPYRVDGDSGNWSPFESDWREFKRWPRGRSKRFLEAVVEDDPSIEGLVEANAARGFPVPRPGANYASYFDALEMLDYYVDINWNIRQRPAHRRGA